MSMLPPVESSSSEPTGGLPLSHYREQTRLGQGITLVVGGDLMLGRGVDRVVATQGPAHPLASLGPIFASGDLIVVNLECALTLRRRRYSGRPKMFLFQGSARGAHVLEHAGIGLVSLANNHILDAGEQGLFDTLALLNERNVGHAGAGATLAQAEAPAIVDRGGTRIGMLSCCDHQADFGARSDRPGMWYLNMKSQSGIGHLLDTVRDLARDVTHVVVALHWQPNWAPTVAAPYRRLAGQVLDAGASLVVGHSPHHFQGVEWAGAGSGAVLYSTGDLVSDYAVDATFRNDRQLVFEVMLSREGGGVNRVRAHPIELGFGRTMPAGPAGRAWITERFRAMCAPLGTAVEDEGTGWLEVLPGG